MLARSRPPGRARRRSPGSAWRARSRHRRRAARRRACAASNGATLSCTRRHSGRAKRLREAEVKSASRVPTANTRSASAARLLAAALPVTPIAPTACGWSAGEGALAGLGLGDRDAVTLGELGERAAGEAVVHAAAGDDERRRGLAQRLRRFGELRRVGRRAADGPAPLPKEFLGVVIGLGLDVLRQAQRHRAAFRGVGQDAHRLRQALQDLLRPRDAVPKARDRAEAIIGARPSDRRNPRSAAAPGRGAARRRRRRGEAAAAGG